MGWTIELTDDAVRQLEKLGRPEAKRIRAYLRGKVASLDSPRLIGRGLTGSEFGHLWRYRVGDYRILCELRDKQLVVLVVEVGHRSRVYK